MSFTNIDTTSLRSFVAIVDTGNYALAALVTGRTQSAISQQIQKLEDQLGLPLFSREGRNKIPTVEGMKIYDIAKRMLDYNDAMLLQASISAKLLSERQSS